MSPIKKKQKHDDSNSLDEFIILPSGDHPLDLDLSETTTGGRSEISLDLDVGTDLIPVEHGQELTLRSSKRNLINIPSLKILDAYDSKQKRIIHPEMDDESILNGFRNIRTYLIQKSPRKNFVLMVVSLDYNMGATFSAVNIGAAFSYEGEKTSLLIDCNQREPKLNKLFDIDIRYGLTDYLHDSEIGVNSIIYQTGIKRMNFIPIGRRKNEGGEFLSSEKMQEFVGVLKRRYADRYIILSVPPLEVSADAAILSEIADYIVIVVPYGRVTKSRINKAVKLLPQEKVVGIILNKRKNYVRY